MNVVSYEVSNALCSVSSSQCISTCRPADTQSYIFFPDCTQQSPTPKDAWDAESVDQLDHSQVDLVKQHSGRR